MQPAEALLQFIAYTEGLKRELRNSWLSNDRQESVADHSWRMAMMVIVLAPYTQLNLDIEKALKMAIVHDLAEIETGDIPTVQQTQAVTAQKRKAEDAAFIKISSMVGDMIGKDLYAIWHEFEEGKTAEARFVQAIDKFECIIQKNQQSVDKGPGAPGYFEKLATLCADDPLLRDLYDKLALPKTT